MSRIGVYDLDWHFGHYKKKIFNLDLMKVFKYYWDKGDIVKFISPDDRDVGYYDAVYYFKDNPKLQIPDKVKMFSNCHLRGYGFYNKYIPLREDVFNTVPSFMPYELLDMHKKMEFLLNNIKIKSYIRLETEDYSHHNNMADLYYVADYDVFRLDNIGKLLDNKDAKYYLFWATGCDSREKYNEYKEFSNRIVNRRLQINFNYDYNFIFNNMEYRNIYPIFQKEETREQDLVSIIEAVRTVKKNNGQLFLVPGNDCPKKYQQLYTLLCSWALNRKHISFYDYCSAVEEKRKIYNAATIDDLELNKLLRTKI